VHVLLFQDALSFLFDSGDVDQCRGSSVGMGGTLMDETPLLFWVFTEGDLPLVTVLTKFFFLCEAFCRRSDSFFYLSVAPARLSYVLQWPRFNAPSRQSSDIYDTDPTTRFPSLL